MDPTLWFLLKKYYDSSKGIILSDSPETQNTEFPISCGVKQGGILSPFLFNIFINELIEQCCQLNLGATYEGENVSILVYADDILLISPVDKHLQDLLDKCTAFSEKWCVKFNPNKSNIIQFGKPLLSQYPLILNNKPLTFSNSLKYLGIEINNNFDPNITAIEKFKKVQKSIFSLSFLGLRPNKISPFLQSSIFKNFLSRSIHKRS